MRRSAPVLLAVAASIALSGCTSAPQPPAEDDVFTLVVGDCFDSDTAEGESIETVPTVPCTDPHDFEAYSSQLMDQDEFPGDSDTIAEADARCGSAFEQYVGVTFQNAFDASLYGFTYFYPSTASWGLGDREILCMVYSTDETGELVKTTGSLEGVAAPTP